MPKKKINPFKHPQETMQKNSRLIGGYLPLPLANFMRLAAVFHGLSVQKLLYKIIANWYQGAAKDEQTMIVGLIMRGVTEWNMRETDKKRTEADINAYIREMETALCHAKMPMYYLQQIRKGIHEILIKKIGVTK